MTVKFFANVKTLDELKTAFKRLMMKNHPDKGGDTATCQAINAEYEVMLKKLINANDESLYTKNEKGYSFWEDKAQHTEVELKVKEALNKIIHLDGLEIEIVGVWIWVGGDTKPHKEALKEAGFKWIPNKLKWAFAGKKSNGYGKMSMDEVREKYGSQAVKKDSKPKIAQTKKRLASA